MTTGAKLRTVPSVPFSPSQLPSLAGWYRGDDLVGADAAAISQWDDVSGNTRHATQATGASQPAKKTAILNGHAVARFDGTADNLRADGLSSVFSGTDLPSSIFAVAKVTSVAVNSAIITAGRASVSTTMQLFRVDTSSSGCYRVQKRDDAVTLVQTTSGASTADLNWNVLSCVFPGTTVGAWENGTAIITAGTALDVGVTTIDQVAIGASVLGATPSAWLAGDLAELLVYNRALATAERVQVQRHLGAKYGITVT